MTHIFLNRLRSLVPLCITVFMMYTNITAQQSNSLYFMDGIPQSNQLNPATQPRFGWYIGIPALSSIEVNAGNSSVGFKDFVNWNGNPDSLLSKFSKNNIFSAEARIDWLSFGFRINNSYVSFSAGDRIEANADVPYGLMNLIINPPSTTGVMQNYDLSGLGGNATWYREYALGYSIQVDDQLTFGVRGKLLYGIANLSTQNSNTTIHANGDSIWQIQSTAQFSTSIPGMNIYFNGTKLDSVKFNKLKTHDIINMVNSTQNPGAALDLGFIYKLRKDFTISASVVDLGFIQWHTNVNNINVNGSYKLQGASVSNYFSNPNILQSFSDTLKQAYSYSHTTDSYITALYGKIYLGAYYQPLRWLGLGALSRTQITNGLFDQQYTLAMNLMPSRGFNFSLSYTVVDNTYDNLGVGFYFNIGPMQLYFMSERIPVYWDNAVTRGGATIPIPYDEKSLNFHLGMNLVFGSERNKKLKLDKPLLEVENHPW